MGFGTKYASVGEVCGLPISHENLNGSELLTSMVGVIWVDRPMIWQGKEMTMLTKAKENEASLSVKVGLDPRTTNDECLHTSLHPKMSVVRGRP